MTTAGTNVSADTSAAAIPAAREEPEVAKRLNVHSHERQQPGDRGAASDEDRRTDFRQRVDQGLTRRALRRTPIIAGQHMDPVGTANREEDDRHRAEHDVVPVPSHHHEGHGDDDSERRRDQRQQHATHVSEREEHEQYDHDDRPRRESAQVSLRTVVDIRRHERRAAEIHGAGREPREHLVFDAGGERALVAAKRGESV